MTYNVGDTVTLDGVESLIIYKADTEQEWGQYIVVDKNHDLCYYFLGNDFVDDNDYENNKWGYEWGGYGTFTKITDQPIGTGLSNTNSLILMNLEPYYDGWEVVWNKITEFRAQLNSDKWFLPSKDELDLIYDNRGSLSNLSLSTRFYYWSSTEDTNGAFACSQSFGKGSQSLGTKYEHYLRCRLCRYTTDSELNSWISNETLSKDKLNRMETNLQSINSSYQITNWQDNDIVTADKLNKLEQGLKEVKSDYTEHTWVDGEEITATKLNNISLNI